MIVQHDGTLYAALPNGVGRYDIMNIIKRAGKHGGFTPRMIQLLDYYMAFTREVDWEEGAQPIIYQCLASTARDLDVTERQIQNIEKQLAAIGALGWSDSGNYRRYGCRDHETGRIQYAFGVNLAPLCSLYDRLKDVLAHKEREEAAWKGLKRAISSYRGQIGKALRALENDADTHQTWTARYKIIAMPIRAHFSLEKLRRLEEEHRQFAHEITRVDAKNFVHLKNTKHLNHSNKLDTGICRASPIGLQGRGRGVKSRPKPKLGASTLRERCAASGLIDLLDMTMEQIAGAASSRFRDHLPSHVRKLEHVHMMEAAHRLRRYLGIPEHLWNRCAAELTPVGAMICVIMTDHAAHRPDDRVISAPAYFNALITRAKTQELRLNLSIIAAQKRAMGHSMSKPVVVS